MTPESFLAGYESALSTQQWDLVEPYFHESACVTFSNGTFKGKAEIQGVFERNFALIQDEQYGLSEQHWVTKTDELAICLYQFYWQGLIEGEPASGSGRGTSVLIQTNKGWQIISEHLGPVAE